MAKDDLLRGLLDLGVDAFRKLKVDGTLGQKTPDVTFRGLPVSEWGPQDWGEFGARYGVDNLGPLDETAWRGNLQSMVTNSGREFTVPGGDGPFSYYDLLHLKAQGINPTDLDPKVHQGIHDRMVSTLGQGELTDERIANQILFGLISPNQPLTPNEMALQRVMVKGPEDLGLLGDMVPYRYTGDIPNKKEREELSRLITPQLGLNAASRGGIGASGSANYTDLAEFAQKMADRPDFYRFNADADRYAGMSDSEKWAAFVTEVMNETRGLKAKTGSLGTVWQDPANAQISAIDRHMATLFNEDMFPSAAEGDAWAKKLIDRFNADRGTNVQTLDELQATPGGRGAFVDAALSYVNRDIGVRTRSARTGEFNERVPEYLRQTNWISGEPEQLELIGPAYTRALDANAANAARDGQAIFPSQWMLWDRIRQRLEPHEVLFPGLEKLPRMSLDQARATTQAHSGAGYMAAEGAVRPVANPSRLGLFSAGGAAAATGLLGSPGEAEAQTSAAAAEPPRFRSEAAAEMAARDKRARDLGYDSHLDMLAAEGTIDGRDPSAREGFSYWLADKIAGDNASGGDFRTAMRYSDRVSDLASFLPGPGTTMAIWDGSKAAADGRYLDAAIDLGSGLLDVATVGLGGRALSGVDDAARRAMIENGLIDVSDTPIGRNYFSRQLSEARDAQGPIGRSVDVYPPDGYRGMTMRLNPEGDAGYVVKPDGELASLVKHPDSNMRGFAGTALRDGEERGAQWLNAFDTALTQMYGKNGYRTVSRTPFSEEFARSDWGDEAVDAFMAANRQYNGGRPDLAFMVRDPARQGPYGGLLFDDYGDAMGALEAEMRRMGYR